MSTFLFDEVIFGPIHSRRLGISLGVNVLPDNSKLCNFDCIYCECGWTHGQLRQKQKFHPREYIQQALEKRLAEMNAAGFNFDVITFAGNGEPTMHPDFEQIIDDTIALRNKYFPAVKIAVLSNATLIHKRKINKALRKVDQNILKLDSVFEETIKAMNQPLGKIVIKRLVENLEKFNGALIIQTMFIRANYNGKVIDNTTETEIAAWLNAIKYISPKLVMIYTIARDTPAADIEKISIEELERIADRVKSLGIDVQVSG